MILDKIVAEKRKRVEERKRVVSLEEIKRNLKKLPYEGVDYRLETTGKGTQFGNLQELVDICKEDRKSVV